MTLPSPRAGAGRRLGCALTLMHRAAFAQSRKASTFPFPRHDRPTPHQIFHLPVGASQQDIKSRYYDLVRVHHPDSPLCRDVPPNERHARFQSITRAYDILRGRISGYDDSDDPVLREILRRKRLQELRRREEMRRRAADLRPEYTDANADGAAAAETKLKDAMIVGCAAFAVGIAIAPTLFGLGLADQRHRAAAANLAEARRDAREFGHEQRVEIRRRVQEYREQEERGDAASCNWQRERGA